MNKLVPLFLVLCLGFSSCKNPSSTTPSDADFEAELQENINKAKDGDVIELPAGTFHISRTLVINHAENLTILGKGKDKTILDFQSKQDSVDGWKIISDGAVLNDFTIRNTSGNGIVAEKTRGIKIHGLKINSGAAHGNNSSGILLRECAQSLLEQCDVSGFAMGGVDFLSCEGTIVHANNLQDNCAGIATMDCAGVDITDNIIARNTAAMFLCHNSPATKKGLGRYRISGNHTQNNNKENKASVSTLLSAVPAGTGIFIMGIDRADIFANTFELQHTTDIIVLSGLTLQKSMPNVTGTYSSAITMHENKMAVDSIIAPQGAVGQLLTHSFGNKIPDIVFDGYINPSYLNADGTVKDERRFCIRNNGDATFGNMDLPGSGAHRSNDIKKYDCGLTALPEVKLN